ncbi:MAG TPA: PAS domain-containing protein, partial [Anaerolineae bacterium]|nr:PAS domain-containing protein [Anaerolineae bacterium]
MEFDQLRTEIWKLALIAEDETTLVQTLLDKAGPVMGCENISFMPYDEALKDVVVKLQWRADGKDIGLGEIIPKWVFKRYLGRPYVQVSLDHSPFWLKAILKIFERVYGTRSVLIVPYGDPQAPDGYISVNNYTTAKEYSPQEIELFIELSKIIHLRSKQLQSQAALQASEIRLELALQGAELGTWDWQVQTGEVIFDERWAEMLGYKLDEVEPTVSGWQKLMHPDDIPAVMATLTDHLEGRTLIYQTEHRLRAKSGEWKWVLDTGKVFERDSEGKPLRATGTHQDITQRKEMEQQLVQQERLAAVGQLAAGIAHDFNNLLTGILGFSELIELSPETPASLLPHLQRITNSSRRAAHLVHQLLDFSQKSIRRPKRFALDTFTTETMTFLERTIPENIRFSFSIAPGAYPIEADPSQMQQVLTNLVINARDAMPAGGTLEIGLSRLETIGQEKCTICGRPIIGEWLCLTIVDSGSGIPAEVLPHIFEPFFTTKAVGKGTGLGLSQVHGILSQHAGHLTLSSQVGQGTRLAIYLSPADQLAGQQVTEAPTPMNLTGHGETLLLVDD